MKLKEQMSTIISLAAVIGIVVGGLTYFATAEDLEKTKEEIVLVDMRLEQKIVADAIHQTQQQMWAIEDRHRGQPVSQWDHRDVDQHRKLRLRLEYLRMNKKKLMGQ